MTAMDDPTASIRRVQRASDQVALQLRDMIVSGALPDGARLPPEHELARRSGVSRATIREALQMLAGEGLTRTRKGVHGGTFVTRPSPDDLADALRFGVTLLSNSNDVTVDDLLETRELLEVPAAGFAAGRRTVEDIADLRAAIPDPDAQLSVAGELVQNKDFHSLVLRAAHNPLLSIAAHPVHHVLVTRLERAWVGPDFHAEIHGHHGEIADAIEGQDAELAQRLMHDHLAWLRPQYERIWRDWGDPERAP
jgi:GntR family transcriptional repressor for pyruvate dehydrogenase complex